MPVQVGTAYVRVDADFSTFERQLHERIHHRVTQHVEPQLNEAGLREQVRTATRPVTQDVHMQLDQASMRRTEGEAKGLFGRIGTAGKLAIGGAAVYLGAQLFEGIGERIKTATESTLALGRAADTLHATTGISVADSARLVASANALDIPTRTLGVSLKQLSAQYVGAEAGSKKARGAFKALGISQKELNATHGDTGKLLGLVTERLDKTKGSAEKTAAASTLLGRGFLTLTPLLQHGGHAMRELNDYAEKLGITFDKNTSKHTDEAELALAKWHLTQQAVQLFIVNKLVPAFLKFTDWFEAKGLPALKQMDHWFKKNILPTLEEVGRKLTKDVLPVLKDVGGAVGGFVKHNPDLAAAAVSVAALAGAAAKLKDSAIGRGIGMLLNLTKLTGVKLPGLGGGKLGSGSATMEVGEMTVGTLIAKTMIGGGGGGGGGALSKLERDAEKAGGSATVLSRLKALLRGGGEGSLPDVAARLAIKSPVGAAGLLTGGVLAFSGASKADNTPVKKIQGAIEAIDPTQVLNAFGMPSVSQLVFGDPSAGRKSWQRVTSGHPMTKGWGQTAAGRPGGPAPLVQSASAKQQTRDFLSMNAALARLESHQRGLKATAFDLDWLAKQAKKVGDVKFAFADRLGAQFLKAHSVSSRGVRNILKEMERLPRGARRQAEEGAVQMAKGLEAEGRLPKKAAVNLTNELLTTVGKLPKGAKVSAGRMADTILDNIKLVGTKGIPTNEHTKNIILGQFEELRKKGGPKWRGVKNDAITAFTDLQNGVVPTGDRTAQALYNAFKAMGVNANQLASALGIKPIQLKMTVPNASQVNQATGVGGAGTIRGIRPGTVLKADGGLIQIGRPGAAGRDTIPLNMGGIPIAVGEGEQVAVFNRHQAPIMNEALSRMGYGGLPGLFRRVNKLNYMAGGGILPKRFAGGGTFSYGQLEGLWNQAGGAPSMAPLMAAIALAESGGNARIVNSIGASGLWQIHPAMPGDLNPLQNARYAVGKLQSQGLRAWETYTNGAYRAFLHGGVPAIGGAGATEIARAIISGPAGIAKTLAQSGADWGRKRINSYLATHMPVAGPGGVSTAGITGAGGLGSFDGLRVANWIVPILNWARSHGWAGHITSGYRPGAITNVGNLSNHARVDYPGGAVDVGDQHAIAQGEALWNVVKGYTGSPRLYSAAFGPGAWGPYKDSPHDYGHFSATGHAGGGLVQGFNGGGHPRTMLGHRAITHHTPWWQHALDDLKHNKLPSGPKLEGLLGHLRHIGLSGWDKPQAKHGGDVARDATLESVASGLIDTEKIAAMLTANPTLWPDPTKPISESAMHTILRRTGAVVQGKDALQWLGTELGHQMALRRSLIKLAQHVKQQYDERRKILEAALRKRQQLQDRLKSINAQLHPKGKHAKPPTGAHHRQLTTELATATRQLAGVQSVITVTQNQMGSLSTAWGAPLGGVSLKSTYDLYGPTSSGGSGTEGVLGQLYALQGPVRSPRVFGLGSSARDLIKALPGSVKNWYGDIGTTLSSMTGFGSSFFTAPTPADAADATGPTIDPFSLELQRLASQRGLIGQLQGPLISAYPYGGSFGGGGTVPGPPGMPVMIQAHGGEQVISLDDQGGAHTVEIHGDARTVALLEAMIETVNVRSNRGQARSADRRMRLPGNQVR